MKNSEVDNLWRQAVNSGWLTVKRLYVYFISINKFAFEKMGTLSL